MKAKAKSKIKKCAENIKGTRTYKAFKSFLKMSCDKIEKKQK
jgi:hypothetical protein